LLIALHGGAGNARAAAAFFGLEELADREGLMLAYPQGLGVSFFGRILGTWNAGRCCGPARERNIDDSGFIAAMLDDIAGKWPLDERRVYVTGMSNGAMMAYRLACDLPGRIAAIAPVGAIGVMEECGAKAQARAVPTLHIHGLADPCAPYDGCRQCKSCVRTFLRSMGLPTRRKAGDNGGYMSVPAFMDEWRRRNGCGPETRSLASGHGERRKGKGKGKGKGNDNNDKGPAPTADPASAPDASSGATAGMCARYEHCRAETILCSVPALGHVWPGRKSYAIAACRRRPQGYLCRRWRETVGPLRPDFKAGELIWRFFSRHSLPASPANRQFRRENGSGANKTGRP
jgi:polyhydroxybutyrate depolymerase